ncbi:pseudouridine-5'-phosphate glycosidase [Lutispora saccharofermentans]|uniref:Pseudouridine-5'-phosphate glycosidase n=1 Tax=Lutispora saccharofermentans TaxID=3024236 RepID=A0ABT1NHI1_9FIRM|nr:pseudouridine-5'-phosphate glycosidase [Lutispora saccharofermentans]MCQ1530699.1 pseudouridine-5'-phosphate glycosidase [Lutispora saccharofermentans]
MAGNKPGFLIETALLTHGLYSVDDQLLVDIWPKDIGLLAWVEKGEIKTGNIKDYIPFRKQSSRLMRIDCFNLDKALSEGLSGALTASGTMAVCAKMGIPLAVTGGMGGIGDIKGEQLCPDLPALRDLPVALISTSPKDMLDIPATIGWLMDSGVSVYGRYSPSCTGFMFKHDLVKITGVYNGELPLKKMLLLYEIPAEKRLTDMSILRRAIAAGKEAEAKGQYYHPAANRMIDVLTEGKSSLLQLDSIILNAKWAKMLV